MRASFTTCIELLCFLFFQQFHAEFLPSSPDGTDSIFGDSPNNPLEAIASVSDGYRSPNSNNLDDPIFIQSFSSTNADDYLASVNPVESDHLDVSMDQCSSADDSWLSGKLRARGAFCTNGDSSPVNQNPSLAGLDASERVTDPENRRQCDAKLETLCCEGPLFPPYVFDCERCKSTFSFFQIMRRRMLYVFLQSFIIDLYTSCFSKYSIL